MSAARGGALSRVALVARAALRDLFAGQAGALLLLGLVGIAVAPGEVRATGPSELHAILLRERVQLVAALAAAATVIASAHAVSEERRTLAFARSLTTPLTSFEALAGRCGGVLAGVLAVAAPVELLVLLVPESGLLRAREQFAPRELVAPSAAILSTPDGKRPLAPREPALLEAGSALELRFDVRSPPGFELALPFALASGEPGRRPLDWSLAVGDDEVMRGHGVDLGLVTLSLPAEAPSPVIVTVRALEGEEVLRIDAEASRLRGPPRSIARSVARALAGLLALLALSTALGGALAAALPDALAMVGAGCLLLLGAMRPLLLDVTDLASDPHAHVGAAMRAVAEALARLLALFPDLARATAAGEIARGSAPWEQDDLRALGLSLAVGVGAWLAGSAWLRRPAGGSA